MKDCSRFLLIPLTIVLCLLPTVMGDTQPQLKVEQVLQTKQSWDGAIYNGYPSGQPQITVLRISIPAHTALHWHYHPVISAAYILSGELTLEKRDTGERVTFRAGQALCETVDTTHRGFTTDSPAELVVFYAGQVGLPITVTQK
jgi:quercetin dioxygenase-like cupin family protein